MLGRPGQDDSFKDAYLGLLFIIFMMYPRTFWPGVIWFPFWLLLLAAWIVLGPAVLLVMWLTEKK